MSIHFERFQIEKQNLLFAPSERNRQIGQQLFCLIIPTLYGCQHPVCTLSVNPYVSQSLHLSIHNSFSPFVHQCTTFLWSREVQRTHCWSIRLSALLKNNKVIIFHGTKKNKIIPIILNCYLLPNKVLLPILINGEHTGSSSKCHPPSTVPQVGVTLFCHQK